MKTRPASRLLINSPAASKPPASTVHIVQLPAGHDPNSYFVAGATAADFTACLNRRTGYETLSGPSAFRSRQRFPLSLAR